MKFTEYTTIRRRFRRLGWSNEDISAGLPFEHLGEEFTRNMASIINNEDRWRDGKRPYFRVYPSVEKLLLSVDLDISGTTILPQLELLIKKVPSCCITLEFSDSGGVGGASFMAITPFLDERGRTASILVTRQLEEGPFTDIVPITNMSLEEEFQRSVAATNLGDIRQPEETISSYHKSIKVFIGALMLADDPMLIEPIVLNRDAIKYKTASLEERVKMEDRAARNKGRGWAIGKGFEEQCEVSPHFRKSHLALFWTGKGRTTPRLQLRKGCIVKHKKLVEIPTGYHDEEHNAEVVE